MARATIESTSMVLRLELSRVEAMLLTRILGRLSGMKAAELISEPDRASEANLLIHDIYAPLASNLSPAYDPLR